MNRPPIVQQEGTTKKGEGLAQLAAIADVVSRRSTDVVVPAGSDRVVENPAAPPMKRSIDSGDENSEPLKKRLREEEPDTDANGKVIQFRQYQAEIWSEKFEDLIEFRKMFGHCHVPHYYQQNAPLAQWVKRQRYQYKLKVDGKRSTLSDERIRLLNKIGFIWNSHDAVWEERWNELAIYKRLHGDCVVPSNYEKNPQLAVWVKRQRRQYKFWNENNPTSMTKERIDKLEKLGFAWDCRKKDIGSFPEKRVNDEPQNVVRPPSNNINLFGQPVVGIPASLPSGYPKCEFLSFSRKFHYVGKK
ncbi:unnamed protein product [Cylindrotheca closterium]|uniref:Helicase-associated domain-containing protein n=1 Tax=Cylindrotheca closterium TaxID=2856 RepID=A0AAD2PUD7_9STRA|nr:unnamed protein product [Cylindrotheca closterium]